MFLGVKSPVKSKKSNIKKHQFVSQYVRLLLPSGIRPSGGGGGVKGEKGREGGTRGEKCRVGR